MPVPSVATVGVNGIGATFANVITSVNPNGSATTVWVSYGLTGALGTNTFSVSAGNGVLPVTLPIEVTGLTSGNTYFAAVVASNGSGLVTGNTITFVPMAAAAVQVVPIVPFGVPAVSIPHFQVPVSFDQDSGAAVVAQDSLEEVVANVTVVALCPTGGCSVLPTFGSPSPTFSPMPVATDALVAAIQEYEPRATEATVSEAFAGGAARLTLQISTGADQGS